MTLSLRNRSYRVELLLEDSLNILAPHPCSVQSGLSPRYVRPFGQGRERRSAPMAEW